MRSQIVLFLAPVVTLLSGAESFAQSMGGTNGPPAPSSDRMPGPPIDATFPIDDNIFILLFAGLALGVYYIYAINKAKKKTA